MNLIKKLALFVCIALTPAKSSAVGLGDFVANTGIAAAAVVCGFASLNAFVNDRALSPADKACVFGCVVGFAGCTFHTGRGIYRFFKPNQKNN